MEWLKELFVEHSALQAVVVVSLISTIGIGLGKIRFFGISLGTAFIFFVGILAGHFGLSLDPAMLTYAESFGLVIFVYALGLQVGPGFFSSMRVDGLRLMSPAIAVVLLGTALAVGLMLAAKFSGVSLPKPPAVTALGALLNHLVVPAKHFQPSNVHFGLMPEPDVRVKKKERKQWYADRARAAFCEWLAGVEKEGE